MNSTPSSVWKRLCTAARRAPDTTSDASAPYGFATRVVAQAFASVERPVSQVIDRLSWRALGFSGLVMIIAVAANINPVLQSIDEEVSAITEDATIDLASL